MGMAVMEVEPTTQKESRGGEMTLRIQAITTNVLNVGVIRRLEGWSDQGKKRSLREGGVGCSQKDGAKAWQSLTQVEPTD